MTRSTRAIPLVVTGALLTSLALAGCSSDPGDPGVADSDIHAAPSHVQRPIERSSQAASTDASTSATPSPSHATEEPTTAKDEPKQVHKLGKLTNTNALSTQGSGEASLRYTTTGDFAAVVKVDCSRCKGATHVTGPGRISGFIDSDKPLSGSFLMSPMASDQGDQQVWIKTMGPWKATIISWNQLSKSPGPLQGTGPAVVWVPNSGKHATLTYTPADKDDKIQARWFTAGKQSPLMFGFEDETSTKTMNVDIKMPGVLSIQTRGKWKLTPRK